MRNQNFTLCAAFVLTWEGIRLVTPAYADQGFSPPPVGTQTVYSVRGSYSASTELTGDAFTLALDCTCELLAFGTEQSPRYLVMLLDAQNSEMFVPGLPHFLTESDPINGGRVFVEPILLPRDLSPGDLANGHRLLTRQAPFRARNIRLPCETTVRRAGGRFVVTRSMPKEETPVRISRSGKILGWEERYVLDSKDGRLLEGRITYEEEIARPGDLITVLAIDVELAEQQRRALPNLDAEAVTEDARRLQQISRTFREQAFQDPDQVEGLRRSLTFVDGLIEELRRFTEDRPDSPLVVAVPSMRRYYGEYRSKFESWLEGRIRFEEMIGELPPDFTLKTVRGEPLTLSKTIRDKVALISFWHYSCRPCRAETPHLKALYEKYKEQGFVILAINSENDPKELVEKYAKQFEITYPVVVNGREVAKSQYSVSGFPSTFWVDHTGRIVDCYEGFEPGDEKALEQKLKQLLAARNGPLASEDR